MLHAAHFCTFLKFTGLIDYDEFAMLNSEVKLKEIKEYLEKIHETNSNKRTRDSSTAFLDPYEHIDFRPLFEGLTNRYEKGFPSLIMITNYVVFVLRYIFFGEFVLLKAVVTLGNSIVFAYPLRQILSFYKNNSKQTFY